MRKRILNSYITNIVIALLVLSMLPIQALALSSDAISPKESHYLSSYGAYVYPAGGGEIQVWFDVTGTNIMDDIGALSIQIYESTDNVNFEWVKTINNKQQSDLMTHDNSFHGGHVTYQGTPSKYYKARVGVWAGRNGGGDRRYFWTESRFCS